MEISPIPPTAPATATCPNCGAAVPPDAARCPTCNARLARMRPSSSAARAGMSSLAMLAFIVLGALWVFPSLLCRVEMCVLGHWLGQGMHRMVLWIPMMMIAVVNGLVTVRVTLQNNRDGWASYARDVGGTLNEDPGPRLGLLMSGVSVRTVVRGWTVTLENQVDRNTRTTRLWVRVTPRRPFSFALMPGGKMMQLVLSPAVGGRLIELGRASTGNRPEDQIKRDLLDHARFLTLPAIATGDPDMDKAFLLKSDDPDAARDVGMRVRAPALALRAGSPGWQMSLMPGAAGTAMLELRHNLYVSDPAQLKRMHALVSDTLDALAQGGLIAPGADTRAA